MSASAMRRQSNFSNFSPSSSPGPGGKQKQQNHDYAVGRRKSRMERAGSKMKKYSVDMGRSISQKLKELAIQSGVTDRWYLLDPRSKYVVTWDVYMVVLLLFTTTVTPFEVCFLTSALIPTWLLIVNWVVDGSFFADLCFNFNRILFDEKTGIPIADLRVIRRTYLKGYFLVDLLSCLPFDQLAVVFGGSEDKAEALKILRLLKLVRLAKLVKMINSQELMQRAQDFFEFRHGTRRLLRFVFLSMFIGHFMACGWHAVARMEDPNDDSYYDENGEIHDNWISGYFLGDSEPSTSAKYVVALYLSVMTITTVGYGDVQPRTTGERIYLIIAMLFGASMQAYVVGSICGIISNLNQRSGEFNQVMDALNAFISENKIESDLSRRLRAFMRYSKQNNNNFRKWQTVLQIMSPKLQEEAALTVNIQWMNKIELFQNVPKEMIVNISFALKSVSFAPFETIIQVGKKIDKLYIVRRGLVFKDAKIQSKDTVIGDEMLHSKYSLHTATSMTFVDTNTIDYTDFQMILDKYSAVRDRLKKSIVKTICRRNVLRFAKAVKAVREDSEEIIRESRSESEAWAKILKHRQLADFSQEGKMAIVRKSLHGTMTMQKLSRIVIMIQRAYKRYKEKKMQRIMLESQQLSLYNIKEHLRQSEEATTREFQEIKERMQRLGEQQRRLFAELLYIHKFSKTT